MNCIYLIFEKEKNFVRKFGNGDESEIGKKSIFSKKINISKYYLPTKSRDITCPHTDVIRNVTFSFRNTPFHSCTEHALFEPAKNYYDWQLVGRIFNDRNWFEPFRFECRPLLNIVDNDAANEGFSATINTVFIFTPIHSFLDTIFQFTSNKRMIRLIRL